MSARPAPTRQVPRTGGSWQRPTPWTRSIALGRDRRDEAVRLARRAYDSARRANLPQVACEALEVVGRCARVDDLDAAEEAFAESHDLAAREGLTVWRLRALHELGTIDMLRSGDLGRLESARELAASTGALSTGAMIDVQLCGVLVGRDDPEPAVAVARRAGDIARRLSLGPTLAAALGFEANAHARAGRPAMAERCLADAAMHAGDDPSVHVFAACARAVTALLDDDREAALTHIEGVAHDIRFFSPLIGWWVLLHALDPRARCRRRRRRARHRRTRSLPRPAVLRLRRGGGAGPRRSTATRPPPW